ncbi:hypothetical protein IT407_00710 [Candidatus Uhrbacteria bacterium]|nr:hypothetical protein [Candidatus Uhrbacteria bacterium]
MAYPLIGVLVAVLSLRAWHKRDSSSFLARLMFPWTWHEKDIGMYPNTLCGLAVEGGRFWTVLYVLLLALVWPCKLAWCLATYVYVTLIYNG